MNHKFLRAALVLITSGLCCGAGVTVDLLPGLAGGNVTFTTTVVPPVKPFVAVVWTVNGTTNIITSGTSDTIQPGYKDRITLDRLTGSLELRNLTEGDNGEYHLTIIPDEGAQILGTTKLEVHPKVPTPTIACPTTTNLIEGKDSVSLTCDADGFISARVWMKDSQPLVAGDRYSFYEDGRVLSISPVNRTDSTEFLCRVSNPASSETAKCSLTVYYGPDKVTITQHPETGILEERVTLTCSADSLPKATFTWMFNQITTVGSVYVIGKVEEEHLGDYTCTAHNPFTEQEASKVHTLTDSSAAVSGSVSMMVTAALMTLVGLKLV
ncbi:cell adhesion molecule CEACAM6-like [Centroberyx affinis]|uniref:cell adhesion molecule CEACAM6-like n=1 Tax=Centroberyx affinis TaxID=166261 RepID=UPI003A5C4C66